MAFLCCLVEMVDEHARISIEHIAMFVCGCVLKPLEKGSYSSILCMYDQKHEFNGSYFQECVYRIAALAIFCTKMCDLLSKSSHVRVEQDFNNLCILLSIRRILIIIHSCAFQNVQCNLLFKPYLPCKLF